MLPFFGFSLTLCLCVCSAIAEKGSLIADGCFWLPEVARGESFDCLNRTAAAVNQCFLFIPPHPLLSSPSPTPETVNMLTQFQNKEGENTKHHHCSHQKHTAIMCYVVLSKGKHRLGGQVGKIWATYCRCFCSQQQQCFTFYKRI